MANPFNAAVFTANTAGVQVAVASGQSANAPSSPLMGEGRLHAVTIGADTTAVTVTIYDGFSTGGTKKFQVNVAIGGTLDAIPDIMFLQGIFIVISGGTTPSVNLSWA